MTVIKFIRPTSLTYLGSEQVAPNTFTFSFKPDTPLSWQAGQHGMLELRIAKGKILRHMFSLSSAPNENKVSITTRYSADSASDYKKALNSLRPSDKAKLRGPVGLMYIRDPQQDNVFIASGIGITPFRSILSQAATANPDLKGILFYENHSDTTVIFEQELKSLGRSLKHFKIEFVTQTDMATDDRLRDILAKYTSGMFYLAGSPAAIKRYKKVLREAGVARSHIKNDPFYGYKQA